MKKVLIILSVILALGLIALFVFHLLGKTAAALPGETQPASSDTAPLETAPSSGSPDAEASGDSHEAPEYPFPSNTPAVTDTQPENSADSQEETEVPTAAPGLDEDETPEMEI